MTTNQQPATSPVVVAQPVPEFEALQKFMAEAFPKYWPAMQACMCAVTTILFKHRSTPMALALVGAPSTGKSTILDMFSHQRMVVPVDDVTSAGFVSQAENKAGQDLLYEIKHKVLVTSDLASIFRGKDQKAAEKYFGRIVRILDGKGLVLSGGFHGRVGMHGDFLFTWLGGTTPLSDGDYNALSVVGPRFLFVQMPFDGISDLTTKEVKGARDYQRKTTVGRLACHANGSGTLVRLKLLDQHLDDGVSRHVHVCASVARGTEHAVECHESASMSTDRSTLARARIPYSLDPLQPFETKCMDNHTRSNP